MAHRKTHEDDIRIGEGLHGLHPAHVRPEVEKVGKITTINHNHPRVQNKEGRALPGVNDGPRVTDPKDSKTGR